MSRSAGPNLPIRVLGYGGAAVLISIAIGILVVTFTGGGRSLSAGGATPGPAGTAPGAGATGNALPASPDPATAAPGGTVPPGGYPGPPVPNPGTGGTGGAGGTGGGSGGTVNRSPCAARTAVYTRSGDAVTVRATFSGTGYVSAFVELTGRGTITKSASGGGVHVFRFTDAPADITRGVGLTTISKIGLATCEVQATR